MLIGSLCLLAVSASAQNLLGLMQRLPALSQIAALIRASPPTMQLLQGANNYTFLAPSNDALSLWMTSFSRSQDVINAMLSYHILAGDHPSVLISPQPSFFPSFLVNDSFTNVTGGQRVEAYIDKNLVFISKNKTISRTISQDNLFTGGSLHVIDRVLDFPRDIFTTATMAAWENILGEFSVIRFNSTESNSQAVQVVQDTYFSSDITWFLPNTATALNEAKNGNFSSVNDYVEFTKYHFLAGSVVYSPQLTNNTVLTMAAGLPAVIRVLPNGTRYINSARIMDTDYMISNGVIHLIDNFLLPGNTTGPAIPTPTPTPASLPTHKKLSTAAYIGLGVGSGAAVLLLVLAVIRTRSKRKNIAPAVSLPKQFAGPHTKINTISSWIELQQPPSELKGNDRRYNTSEMEVIRVPVELAAT